MHCVAFCDLSWVPHPYIITVIAAPSLYLCPIFQLWSTLSQKGLDLSEACAVGEEASALVTRFLRASQWDANKALHMLEEDLVSALKRERCPISAIYVTTIIVRLQ